MARFVAYERVRDLWLWGYLERVELPVARVLGGRRPFLYALGLQAVPIVEHRMGTAVLPVQPRRLDRLDHVFVDHDLKAAALWANLRAQLRGRRGCRWLWIGERELRAKRMRVRATQGDYRLPFLPDGYFEVIYPNGDVQACLVEVDMGTLTLRRFARKMQAFETALEDEVFRRHFKRDNFAVLVLTQSKRRLEALRHVAGRVVPNERHGDYYLSRSPTRWRPKRSLLRPGGIWTAKPTAACSSMRRQGKWSAEPTTPPARLDQDARAAALSEVASILWEAARQVLTETCESPATDAARDRG